MSVRQPLIGIVGSAGAYGRWLRAFFEHRMRLEVIGHDPAGPDSSAEAEVARRADVLVFAVPGRQAPAVIERYRALAEQGGAGRLWLEIASVKSASVAALLESRAEAVGLHPMTAPPQAPTLKGRVVVVCKARLSRWAPWLDELLDALECSAVETTAEHHDRVMAPVQALPHALHLTQAAVFGGQAAATGGFAGLLPFRSALFEMDAAIVARILSLNPAICEDIQFGNPCTRAVLRRFAERAQRLAALVDAGGEVERAAFRREFLLDNRAALGEAPLAAVLMGAGVWLHLTERHEHLHTHEPITHTHRHVRDEHHQHAHDFDWDGREPHTHEHTHTPLTHSHPHYPDIHHQHRHE